MRQGLAVANGGEREFIPLGRNSRSRRGKGPFRRGPATRSHCPPGRARRRRRHRRRRRRRRPFPVVASL